MSKEVMKQKQDDLFNYIQKVIEALYENSDPVSVEAAELLERIIVKQEPLTDEQIVAIVREASHGSAIRREGSTSMRIARAIESAHGIKE